ncbi:TetR/AcrR family transcriptional regulator [Streptomyces krungchingensis]
MSTPVHKRPGGRSTRVRQAVLDATIDLLNSGGLEAVTFPAIADKAGVHRTSLYRRWGALDELLLDALADSVQGALTLPDTGSLREDLIVLLSEVRDMMRSPLGRSLTEILVSSRSPTAIAIRDAYWAERRIRLAAIVERGAHRGELRPGLDPQLVLELLLGPLHARAFTAPDTLTPDVPALIVDSLLGGIGVPGVTARQR